jgi:hypothetical protein
VDVTRVIRALPANIMGGVRDSAREKIDRPLASG